MIFSVSRPYTEDILYFTSPSAAIYLIDLLRLILLIAHDIRPRRARSLAYFPLRVFGSPKLLTILVKTRYTSTRLEYRVLGELVRIVLASVIFFFKFNVTPVPSEIGFYYKGSILCLWLRASEILARVLVKIPNPKDRYKPYRYYRKRVTFYITSLKECFTINIANSVYCEKISGFLKCAQEFLKA
ncbi:hypothetical protein N7504_006268 [Penicillium tannophilum]|nr:hypothetical protein N7504_006268 [Penicillium tannophilum]